ncbi:hypothetical protein BCR34DRAFT_472895, partial [Clohesyomyces aquaticus]
RCFAQSVVLAADLSPISIVKDLGYQCERNCLPQVYVQSVVGLGRAFGTWRAVAVTSVVVGGNSDMWDAIEGMDDDHITRGV